MYKWGVVFIACSVALISNRLNGAEGKISGVIVDEKTREPLSGANVLVLDTPFGAAADAEGRYTIDKLEPGSYNLEFRFLGYKTVKKGNVIVNPNRTTIMDVVLEPSVLTGETIEVSAGYFQEAKEAIVGSRSMDFEEIRRSPGDVVDIQRVVQVLPAVVSGTDQLNEIIVRGGYPGENLFLMDNIEIPNPNHFAVQGAGGGPINMLNSFMVRTIDFYAGAFSARMGDRASSAMEITLRNASRDRRRWEGQLGMSGVGLLLEGPLSSRGGYIFSARKSYLDWIISSTGLTAVPHYHNLQARIDYELNRSNTLILNAVYGNDHIDIEEGDEAGYGRGAENVTNRNRQIIGGATLRTFWRRGIFSNTTLSAVSNRYYVDAFRQPGHRTFFKNSSQEDEYTAKTDWVIQAAKFLELDFGLSFKSVQDQYDVTISPDTLFLYDTTKIPPDSILGIFRLYPGQIIDRGITSYKSAAYLQSVWEWSRWRLTAGLRYDYFRYTRFSSWSPRLGLSYGLTSTLRLKIAYGRHFQSPYPIELIPSPLNRNLRHKYADHWVAGLDWLARDDVKLTLEVYDKKYFDIPVEYSLTTPDPFDDSRGYKVNAGSGKARGIEFFLQKKLISRFSTIISYAYSSAYSIDLRSGGRIPADYDYRHVFTAMAGYKYRAAGRKWYQDFRRTTLYKIFSWLPFVPADDNELSVKWRYLGGRPYTKPVYHPEIQRWVIDENLPMNAHRYPAYHRLDLRLDRRFVFNTWAMIVFFDVINLYGRDNVWSYQYNDDGTVSQVNQFSTMPVGGVSLEF
ncbi:MAG: TonB-dependent receptor [candidate division KSB1 bacterium]|nr:TonB-dependent receptor [candidate division KSB1 bacterium]